MGKYLLNVIEKDPRRKLIDILLVSLFSGGIQLDLF